MGFMSIKSEICEISLLNGAVRLLTPKGRGLKPTTDAVFLASACPAVRGDHILDLGCGVLTVGLCVALRVPGVQITGVERESDLGEMARDNAGLNGVMDADILIGDIRNCPARLDQPVFDHVVMNPPFYDPGTYIKPDDQMRARALGHQGGGSQLSATLDDWIMAAHRTVKSNGSVTMIYHAESVDDIIACAHRRFGGITIIPLWPHAGQAARRVIVRMVKDSRAPAALHFGLVLHNADGTWTEGAQKILVSKEGL
jgi:tRNA1(Val) A37 N6-methylase TrmN6